MLQSPPPSVSIFSVFRLTLLGLLLIFSSCSKEEVDPLPVAEEILEESRVRFVNESSVPFLKQEINKIVSGKDLRYKSAGNFHLNRER